MTTHALRLSDPRDRDAAVTTHSTKEQPVPEGSEPETAATSHTAAVLRQHGVGVKGGVSATQVARRAGVAQETVSRQLRAPAPGRRPPSMDIETIDAIADAVPMPRAVLQHAVLRDAGFIVDVGPDVVPPDGVTVEVLLQHLPGLSDRDRRIVMAELAKLQLRDDSGPDR